MNRRDAERIAAQITERTEYKAVAWPRDDQLTEARALSATRYVWAHRSGFPTVTITDETLMAATILFDAGLIGTKKEATP